MIKLRKCECEVGGGKRGAMQLDFVCVCVCGGGVRYKFNYGGEKMFQPCL